MLLVVSLLLFYLELACENPFVYIKDKITNVKYAITLVLLALVSMTKSDFIRRTSTECLNFFSD